MAEVGLYFSVNLCICHSSFTFLHFEVVVLVSIHLTGLPKDRFMGSNGQCLVSRAWAAGFPRLCSQLDSVPECEQWHGQLRL